MLFSVFATFKHFLSQLLTFYLLIFNFNFPQQIPVATISSQKSLFQREKLGTFFDSNCKLHFRFYVFPSSC